MTIFKPITAILAGITAASLLLLASCGGSTGGDINAKANLFSGSAVSSFSGPDGDDSDARQDARALMVNRTFDFMETGFTIQSGLASTSAPGNVNFGMGSGSVSINGTTGTISLGVAPASPLYSNVDLVGTFNPQAAQSAVDNAGNTFTVQWEMSYSFDGRAYEIHFEQVMTGTDFREV